MERIDDLPLIKEDPISWQDITGLTAPVLFKGELGNWQCVNWSIEDWANKCEDIPFNFRCGTKTNLNLLETENFHIQAKIKDFVSFASMKNSELGDDNPLKRLNSEQFWCYSSYNHMSKVFEGMPHMLDIVDWSKFGLPNRKGSESTLWIGCKHANTPCHQDSYGSNLVAQLAGEKMWVLYPPDSNDLLYPTRIPYEESSVFSSVNILHPDLTAFPKFGDTKPYIIVLKPGDVLYVPPKWWHFVCCLDTAVSINTWVEHEFDDNWRLEEAVARFLMTSFISTYSEKESIWLNPTEELLIGEETTTLLYKAVEKATDNEEVDTKLSSKTDPKSVKNVTELKPVSFEEFEEQMQNQTVYYSQLSGYYKQDRLVNLVNSFLSENVLKCITHNLLHSSKR